MLEILALEVLDLVLFIELKFSKVPCEGATSKID